jgi:hypothetical protein
MQPPFRAAAAKRIELEQTAYPAAGERRRVRVAGVLVLGLVASGAFAALLVGSAGAHVALQAGNVAAADLSVPDPDLAMVAGLAQGPQILGIPTGPAPARVLAVPADAPADLGALAPTGRHFDFTDPHGQAWTVTEYRASWGYAYGTAPGATAQDADAGAYNFVLLVDHSKTGEHVRLVVA